MFGRFQTPSSDARPIGPLGTEDWRALVDSGRSLAEAQDIEQLADGVAVAARRLIGADGATFVVRDGADCVYIGEDAIGPLWRGMRFPMTACISGWAMMYADVAAIPDIRCDARIPRAAYDPTFVRSLLMVPVGRPKPTAAIGAYWRDQRPIAAREIEVMRELAASVASAIASLYAKHELAQMRDALFAVYDDLSIGSWTLDLETFELSSSFVMKSIFGRPADADFTFGELLTCVDAPSRPAFQGAFRSASEAGRDVDVECDVASAGGRRRIRVSGTRSQRGSRRGALLRGTARIVR